MNLDYLVDLSPDEKVQLAAKAQHLQRYLLRAQVDGHQGLLDKQLNWTEINALQFIPVTLMAKSASILTVRQADSDSSSRVFTDVTGGFRSNVGFVGI